MHTFNIYRQYFRSFRRQSMLGAVRSVLVATIGLVALVPAMPALAAGASIYITTNYGTVSAGQSFVIAVYMNGGGNPINAVEADLNYPASQLQYVGLNYSGGAFPISTAGDGGGNGSVSIQNGTTNPISGSGLIATVTFRALSGSGSAAIGVSGSSSLVSATTNQAVPFSSSGLTVRFGASSSTSSRATASAPSQPAAPAPPKDSTPPVISDIKIKNLTPFTATVTWTTNEPSSSEVDYGLDTNYGLSTASSGLTTAHSVVLDSTFLTPETVYHYHVKSADAAGNVAVSSDEHFVLPGVLVTIVVLGANGKPEANASVTLDGATGTTDDKGQVNLPSSLGNKKITTTYQGVTIQKPITVARSAKPLPPYQLDLTRQPLNGWMLTSIGLFMLVLVLLGIDAMLFGSHFFLRLTGLRRLEMASLSLFHKLGAAPVASSVGSVESAQNEPGVPAAVTEDTPVAAETPSAASTPEPTPESAGFNIQTTGDNPTPPTLRAIDNIRPLTLGRSPMTDALVKPRTIVVTDSEPAATKSEPAAESAKIKHPVHHKRAKPGGKATRH